MCDLFSNIIITNAVWKERKKEAGIESFAYYYEYPANSFSPVRKKLGGNGCRRRKIKFLIALALLSSMIEAMNNARLSNRF